MAALTAGVQYSLSSNQNNGLMPKQRTSKNKTLFFVKLTDSCLKAVEDYLRCCQQVSHIHSKNAFDGFCGLSRSFRRFLSFLRAAALANLFFSLATSSNQTFFVPTTSSSTCRTVRSRVPIDIRIAYTI